MGWAMPGWPDPTIVERGYPFSTLHPLESDPPPPKLTGWLRGMYSASAFRHRRKKMIMR